MENGVPMADAAATRTAAERAAFVVVVVLAVCLNARRVFCPTNAELVVVVVVVARDAIIIIIILLVCFCCSGNKVVVFLSVTLFCFTKSVSFCQKKERGKKREKMVSSFDPKTLLPSVSFLSCRFFIIFFFFFFFFCASTTLLLFVVSSSLSESTQHRCSFVFRPPHRFCDVSFSSQRGKGERSMIWRGRLILSINPKNSFIIDHVSFPLTKSL